MIWLVFFLSFSFISFFFADEILEGMIWPLRRIGAGRQLYFYAPHEAFLIHLKTAFFSGFLISCPVFFIQIWRFIIPALYPHEKKILAILIPSSIILFLTGVLFSFFLVLPFSLGFFLNFRSEHLAPLLQAGPYFSLIMNLVILFGILFNFPLFMVGLVMTGITSVNSLKGMRRSMIVTFFILAALLTPSTDPVSQVLLALPLWMLYELSLLAAKALPQKTVDSN
ncbi:MAG: twin-arginine translocase subunit TatC [Candidatus Omnitrophica bacterium]|nr:twin-arginine translocase subunit TatC [Candidatus Omnitrophota bacterium]